MTLSERQVSLLHSLYLFSSLFSLPISRDDVRLTHALNMTRIFLVFKKMKFLFLTKSRKENPLVLSIGLSIIISRREMISILGKM